MVRERLGAPVITQQFLLWGVGIAHVSPGNGHVYDSWHVVVVDIRQCTATNRNQAESYNGSSAMEQREQVQSYASQTELTSDLNIQCNYFALAERYFLSKNNRLGENC